MAVSFLEPVGPANPRKRVGVRTRDFAKLLESELKAKIIDRV